MSTSIVSTSSNLSCPVANSVGVRVAEFTPPASDIVLVPAFIPNSTPDEASVPDRRLNTFVSPSPAIHTYAEALLTTSLTKLVDPSVFLAFLATDKYGKVSRTSPLVPEINPSSSITMTWTSSDVAPTPDAYDDVPGAPSKAETIAESPLNVPAPSSESACNNLICKLFPRSPGYFAINV